MSESLRALLVSSIDYAGVFPPAQLPLQTAVQNYGRYVQEPEAWLLNRFVCPIGLMPDLVSSATKWRDVRPPLASAEIMQRIRSAIARQLGVERERIPQSPGEYWREIGADSLDTVELVMQLEEEFDVNISDNVTERVQSIDDLLAIIHCGQGHRVGVIGKTSQSSKQFMENIGQAVQVVVEVQESLGEFAKVDSLELQLPSDLCEAKHDALRELLDAVRHKVRKSELCPINVFFEIPIGRQSETCLVNLLQAIQTEYDDHLRLKIRTGGVSAEMQPGPQELARFIEACASANVAWKATAGLHEVLTRATGATGTWQFGFLNVLAAAVLASVCKLASPQIELILTETEIDKFQFTDTELRWREFTASVEQIDLARRHSMLSFGSCSFEEPRDGLRRLLLIP